MSITPLLLLHNVIGPEPKTIWHACSIAPRVPLGASGAISTAVKWRGCSSLYFLP